MDEIQWIYYIDVLPAIAKVCAICSVFGIIAIIMHLMNCYCDYKSLNKNFLLGSFIVFILLIFIASIIPSRGALSSMAIQDGVTNERVKILANEWLKSR